MSKNNNANKNQSIINKAKNAIDNTVDNYRETKKQIEQVDDEIIKSEMELRNFRRQNSIRNMKEEIKDVVNKKN